MSRSPNGGAFSVDVIDQRPGLIVFQVLDGNKRSDHAARTVFKDEAGGHRWQRHSPTEKRGRVHTSTITVAVLSEPTAADMLIREQDLEWWAERGHGAGGQHRNKTESAIRVRHRPTGLEAYCQSERSQHQNKASALSVLRARVWNDRHAVSHQDRAQVRRQQVGSGQRGDKRRTIRMQDGQVHDHLTGQRWTTQQYLSGQW